MQFLDMLSFTLQLFFYFTFSYFISI